MYCKNCGNQLNQLQPYCTACGFHPLTEKNYCQTCGTAIKERQVICISYGNELFAKELVEEKERGEEAAFRAIFDSEIQYLPKYYQREFTMIYESDESYTGKWNWSAFFFGSLWALFKGCWLTTLISVVIIFCTFGWTAPIFWIVYGFRGNWIFYNRFVKNKQVAM